MATAKELLLQELQRRQQQEQSDQGSIREDIKSQRAIAEIDPIYRRKMKPQMAFIDELTGSNLAQHVQDPESTEVALRRAFQAQANTPKQNLLGYLQSQLGQERADDMMANKLAVASMKGNQPKKMSGEQMKRLGSARVASQALADVEAALGEGSSILPEFMTGATGDTKFTEAARRFAEGFGRMQSGAAITADEETRFKRLLPRFQDSPEIRQMKLLRLREEIQSRMNELSGESPVPVQSAQTGFGTDGSLDMSKMSDDELRKLAGGK